MATEAKACAGLPAGVVVGPELPRGKLKRLKENRGDPAQKVGAIGNQ